MFTNRQKLTALSICHIFETSKPLGNSTTVAVLNDRAGISYGIPQATHKSGNLADVLERYIASGDEVLYEPLFRKYLPDIRKSDQRTVDRLAGNAELKRALREAGEEPAMRKAQLDNVNSRMNKAIRACAGSGFKTAMALAVIYDSMNHGSWEKIRDKVKVSDSNEMAWITAYVKARQAWLRSIARLKVTAYRTEFFDRQIKLGNWALNLPMDVHGYKLKASDIDKAEQETNEINNIESHNTSKENETANDEQQSDTSSEATSNDSQQVVSQEIKETTKEETPSGSSTVESTTQLATSTDVNVGKERPSFTAKLQAGFAWILAGGGAVVGAIKIFFEQIEQIPTVNIGIAVAGIIALAGIGFLIYDRSAERANRLNLDKMRIASDQTLNNVHLVPKGESNVTTN